MHLKTQGLVCGFKKTQEKKKNQQNGNGVKVVFHSASNIHLYDPHLTKLTQSSPAFWRTTQQFNAIKILNQELTCISKKRGMLLMQ